MIGEEHLRLDNLCGACCLLGCHGKWLIGGEKSHVDVLDVFHLRNILSVARDIDAKAVEGEDKAIVAPFGMELFLARRDVVGWHSIHGYIICEL